jgi:tRNA1(Val) A37 N6-methylase TrmN6
MKVTTDLLHFWKLGSLYHKNFLDIGTGTVACLMMAQRSNGEIVTVELVQESFNQAKENVAGSLAEDRVTHSDISTFNLQKYDSLFAITIFEEIEIS